MDPTTFWLAYSLMAISTAFSFYYILPSIKNRKDLVQQVSYSLAAGAAWPVAIASRIIVRIIYVKSK